MHSFIKIPVLAQNNKADDSFAHIRVDQIGHMHAATPHDRKLRPEINTLIVLLTGPMLATTDNPATILEKIKQAELNAPTPTD